MKTNLRKKALVPAIAMVLASVIALSGVTYAWFTTGTTATVSGLDVNVKAANGIQVSLDANSWKSVVNGEDIRTAITGATTYLDRVIQYPSTEIAPVSSAGNVVDGKLQMFLGEYNSAGNLDSTVATELNRNNAGDFISFDLFFKSSGDQALTLNVGSGMSFVKCINLAENGADSNVGTDKAVRVAFIPMGTKSSEAEARALTVASGTALIWEPNADTRATGVNAGTGELDYSGFKTTFQNVPEASLGSDQVEAVDTFTTSTKIMDLKEGISKVRVYIWLEGQDVDCINNISFGDFSVNLDFSVPEVK